MQQGGDVKGVYEILSHSIKTISESVNAESSKKLGTGMEGLCLR